MRELTKHEVEEISGAFWGAAFNWARNLWNHVFSTTPIGHLKSGAGVITSTYGLATVLDRPAYYDQRGNAIRTTVTRGGGIGF